MVVDLGRRGRPRALIINRWGFDFGLFLYARSWSGSLSLIKRNASINHAKLRTEKDIDLIQFMPEDH